MFLSINLIYSTCCWMPYRLHVFSNTQNISTANRMHINLSYIFLWYHLLSNSVSCCQILSPWRMWSLLPQGNTLTKFGCRKIAIYNVFFNYFMVILHVRSILMIRDDQIDIWTSFCEFICTIYNDTCIIRSISLRRNNIYCHNISIRNATNILICSQFFLIMLLNWFAQ